MLYPPAPWKLQGYAIATLQLIDIARVRPLVPSELEIISLFPGKTLGGIYISSYGLGSVMEYNELISDRLLYFKGEFQSRSSLIQGELEIPQESPFASINIGQPLLTVAVEDLRLIANKPEIVGNRVVEF